MPVPQSSGNRARTCAKTSVAFSRTHRIAEKSLFSDSEDEQGVPTPRIRPKRVRVICTDPDATDSSTDDEETWCSGYVRKQIQDIYLDNYRSPSTGVVESNNGGRPSRTIVSVEPGFRQADCSQFLNFVKKNGEWYTEKFLEWTLAKAPETTAAKTCVTNSEVCNSHKGERVNKSRKFRGVRLRAWGKWAAEIRESSCSRLWLGSFDSAEEAALAYDRAARKIHGPRAITNFSEARFQELTRPKSRKRSVSDEVDSEEAGLAYDKPFRRLRGPHASTNLSAARFQESGSRKSRKRSVRDEVGSSDPQLERYDKSLGRIGKSAKISTNICASKCAPMSFSEKSEIFNLKDMFCASSPSSVLVECLSSGSLESPGASSPSSSSQDMNSSPEYLNCSSFKEVSSQPQPRCLFQGDDSSATAQVSCLPGLSSSSLLEDAPGFSGDQQFKVFQTLPCQNELISAAGTEQDIMEIGSKLYAEDFDMEFGSLNFLDHGESVVDLADVADLFNEEDYAGLLSFENDANALSSWLSFPDSSY